jgi:hypothetical protein
MVQIAFKQTAATLVPLPLTFACGTLRQMVWFSDSGREQRPWARVLALAVSIFLVAALGSLRVQGAIEPDSIEVLTYLRTQAPPAVGAPVCLAEAGSVVGNVKSVRLMPGHESTHDLWEVVMELNPQDASKVSTGSVVYACFGLRAIQDATFLKARSWKSTRQHLPPTCR